MKSQSVEHAYQEFSLEYFRELATFGALSDEIIKRLMCEGCLYELEAGETLYSAGDKVQFSGFHLAREMARTIGELGDLIAETELKGKGRL